MLRKLIKHEFRATGRIMLPMYIVLLLTSVGSNLAGRGLLGSRQAVLSVLGGLLIGAFGFAIAGVFVVAFTTMVQRFYKNLLQDEGYLMFTLPVSVHQHIWAKLFVSAVWFAATILAVILACCIVSYDMGFLRRELLVLLRDIFEGLQKLKISEALNGTVILVEFAVLCFLGLAAFSLQFYAALAAGHSRPNHKMAWSVVLFFVFQFAVQFCGSLLLMGLNKVDFFRLRIWPGFELGMGVDFNGVAAAHVALLTLIVGVVIYGAIFYTVTTFFLKRHLNLE